MFTVMLDSKFNNLILISYFIGHEHGMVIVEKYDKKFLFLMFLKSYHHLHQLSKIKSFFVTYIIGDDSNLNIFEMLISINIKCLLEWWRKHETMFSIVNF